MDIQRDHSQGHTVNKLKKKKLNWGSIGPKSTARTCCLQCAKEKSTDFKEHVISKSRLLLVKKKKLKAKQNSA